MSDSVIYPLVEERIAFETYKTLPGENATGLLRALVSPLEYAWAKKNEREDTDAYRVGRATHTATLEPLRFLKEYVLWEGGDRRGKAWEEFKAKNEGKTILKPELYDPAVAMSEAIRAHPVAGPLVSGAGRNELTVRWRHSSGALCKGRIDRLTEDALIDIKTASDITPDGFARQSFKLGYHTRMAFYRDAIRAALGSCPPVLLIVVSKKPPHDVIVHEFDLAALDVGREQYEKALSVIAECTRTKVWPGIAPSERVPLKLPHWAAPQFNEAEAIEWGNSEVIA